MKNLKYLAVCALVFASACEGGKIPSKPFPKPPRTTTTISTSTTSTVLETTTTTITPGTTTTMAPGTTTSTPPISTTSTSTTTSTTTTTPQPVGCTFQKASLPLSVAFCETFDVPKGNGTQTGDLDPVLWGVSRVADWNPTSIMNGIVPSHNACANGALTPTPGDVRICNGQMVESINDGGGVVNLDTYPKQPFNFAGRTGTVVFDVSADSQGTHAAWPEFAITDEPVPGVRRAISSDTTNQTGANSVGFSIDGCGSIAANGTTGVGAVFYSKNGVYKELNDGFRDCITKGSRTAMNHFEVRVNVNTIEVWASNGGSSTLKLIASEVIPGGLTFTQGLVWLNDAHYNARKAIEPCACGPQFDHSFFWDNLGFDGPKTYRDLGFDVPYAYAPGGSSSNGESETNLGYWVSGTRNFIVTDVNWTQTPTKAKIVFNNYSFDNNYTVSVRLNGHTYQSKVFAEGFNVYSSAIDLPFADVLPGNNTLTFQTSGGVALTNMSIILVAAAPVP